MRDPHPLVVAKEPGDDAGDVPAATGRVDRDGLLLRLDLGLEPDNHPSIAVARSAGFRPADSPPETVTDKGRTYELLTWEHRLTADRA
ncbi:hypothetical protein [Streptomyces sp. NPDC057966]|uniref:hypothetical protein n=1 Tax=Streptomyces sp. NPDC057966 TaxID=3346292 RepID=UPI0036F05F2D